MNNYILYYYLREDLSSPYYVGYGKPRRINARHSRRNGAEILPPRHRRYVVKSGLTKEEAIDLEIKHIALWKRELDGGVLLNQNLGGDGKPGGQKTIGFGGRRHTEEARKKISVHKDLCRQYYSVDKYYNFIRQQNRSTYLYVDNILY